MNTELWKKWKASVLIGLGILILAVFLRTFNIFSLPIFADEAIYVRWAQIMRAEPGLRFLPLSDGKQPLFMWVVIPFLKVFSDPLVAGRILSGVMGVAGVVGVFLLSWRLFKAARPALLSALFYAVSPFLVFFDRMALVDSMLATLGVGSVFFGVLLAQTLRLDVAMFLGFSLGAAWLTKSPAIFFLALVPFCGLAVEVNSKRELFFKLFRFLGLVVVAWIIAFSMYNILRLGPNFHLVNSRNQDYVFTLQEVLRHPMDPFVAHVKEISGWLWSLLPGPLLIISFAGAIVGLRRHLRGVFLLLIFVSVPLFIEAQFAKVFTSRYILFTVPYLVVLAGLGTDYILLLRRKAFVLLAIGAIVGPALYFDWKFTRDVNNVDFPRDMRSGYLEEWTSGVGIREAAGYIKGQKLKIKNNIVVGSEGYFGTPLNALEMYLADIPGIKIRGVGITLSEVPQTLVDAKKAGDIVYLVINSTRFTGELHQPNLRLVNSYPKHERANGTRESLLLFEVTEDVIESK